MPRPLLVVVVWTLSSASGSSWNRYLMLSIGSSSEPSGAGGGGAGGALGTWDGPVSTVAVPMMPTHTPVVVAAAERLPPRSIATAPVGVAFGLPPFLGSA